MLSDWINAAGSKTCDIFNHWKIRQTSWEILSPSVSCRVPAIQQSQPETRGFASVVLLHRPACPEGNCSFTASCRVWRPGWAKEQVSPEVLECSGPLRAIVFGLKSFLNGIQPEPGYIWIQPRAEFYFGSHLSKLLKKKKKKNTYKKIETSCLFISLFSTYKLDYSGFCW